MNKKYHRRSPARFYVLLSLLLGGLVFAPMAGAVTFSSINTSPCTTSGASDNGGFCSDVGIDYSQLTGNLVTSVHFDTDGTPNSIDNVSRSTGTRVPLASFAIAGEVKVATVRQVQGSCLQQWPVGTVFTGNGIPGQIVKIDPDGTVTNPWRDLSAFGENGVFTGFFHDRWCVSGGDLIVVSGSDDGMTGGFVWRVSESADPLMLVGILKPGIPQNCGPGGISSPLRREMDEPVLTTGIDPHWLVPDEMHYDPVRPISLSDANTPLEQSWREAFQRRKQKTHVLLASLFEQSTPCVSATLKGVITVPNDPQYGPWAGMIVTGDDDQIVTRTGYLNGNNPKIYAVNPILPPPGDAGTAICSQNSSSSNSSSCSTTFTMISATGATGGSLPHPEDFDFIEGDFFGVSYLNSSIPELPGQILTAPSADFSAQTGPFPDILVTQEYPVDQPNILSGSPLSIGANSGLYTVQWNANAGAFVTAQLPRNTGPDYTQWEHITFAPPPPGLKVEMHPKQGEPGNTFSPGAQASFTIVVSNPGTGTATNVQLTDLLPGNGGLMWQTATSTQGNCVSPISNNSLSCSLGNIAPGGSVTVTVTSTASTPLSACQDQPNPAAIATEQSGLTAQDSGFLTCTPPLTQLKVEKHPKAGEPGSVFTQGSQVSFTIVVSNPGSSGGPTATNVQLTDLLPGNGGLVWQGATTTQGSCTNPIVGNALSCSLGDIAPGGAVTVTVTSSSTIPAAACQDQPNLAAVAASGNLTAHDSGFLTCTATPPAQLAVAKTPKSGTFVQGSQVSFTILVSNPAPSGSQAASNVQLTDILPGNGGLVWEGVTTTQGSCVNPIGGNILSCSLGTIQPQSAVSLTVLSTATTPLAACQSQSNPVALATADGGLRAQDTGSLTCTPPPAQLAVVKTPKNGTFTQGSQVSFTIVVSNPAPTGAQTATNVQLSDMLPGNGGLVWQKATPTQGSCVNPIVGNALNCSLGNIPPGGAVTVTVTSTATTPTTACQDQSNAAAIATSGNLTVQDSGFLTCRAPGSISLSKTPDGATFNSGQQLTFTMVVSSNGPGTAQNVTLSDPLPATGGLTWGVTSVTPAGNCSVDASQKLSCSFGDLAAGANRTVVVITNNPGGTPAAACTGSKINNVATASATGLPDATDSGSYTCNVCNISGGSLSFAKNTVAFKITNGNSSAATLTQVVLNWPTANGKLMKILLGTNVVYDVPDLPPPSATIATAQLVADATKRTLAAGGSAVITLQFEKNADTNASNYSGTFSFGGCSVTFSPQNACFLGYPYVSSNPKTSVVFNENGVLQQINPSNATAGGAIQVYATDEHAPLLGVRTATMAVSAMPANPGHVSNPLIGDPSITDSYGRPIHPGLYITDVTSLSDNATHTDPAIRAGDWQYCSPACKGTPPNDVFGTWKGASVSGTILTTDADPTTKNVWNLGPGSDVPSGGFAGLDALGYGTEFRWNVSSLTVNGQPLQSGHTYRVQVIVHDGDQNKTGGDVGQACATITIQ